MPFFQLVSILEEIVALFNELKSNGTIDELVQAEKVALDLKAKMDANPKIKDLEAKLGQLFGQK